MLFNVITLFSKMFDALHYGIVGRAIKNKLITINFTNPRDFAVGRCKKIDDSSYGGGVGMVMMFDQLQRALLSIKKQNNLVSPHVVLLSPQGKLLNQNWLKRLIDKQHLILIAARYEGVDERFIMKSVNEEISIGDYVISGGEFAVMVLIDAITRLLPNAIKNDEATRQDSFVDFLLEYPHYTKSAILDEKNLPKILKSGNHKKIYDWRLKQALGRTWLRRPDLLQKHLLTRYESLLLNEFILELGETHP